VTFESNRCLACGSPLGYSVGTGRVVVLHPGLDGRPEFRPRVASGADPVVERPCANQGVAACTWLAPETAPGGLCVSCRLTRTRPNDGDPSGLASFARAELAKRWLVHQLLDIGLPVVSWMEDPQHGLAVDLLSSRVEPVVTGHADGVITLDLAESDDPHREAVRVELREPYRTVLGHLRHESGHYYWQRLAAGRDLARFRELFGDETINYSAAVAQHYASGPPFGWEQEYVSAYATMHPWEDWAETFAHYLHLREMLQTAQAYGLAVRRWAGDGAGAGTLDTLDDLGALAAEPGIQQLIDRWLPLSYALNAVNRSMGRPDLYPFVLTERVITKLDAVHSAVLAEVRGEPVPAV
jgi:hypothetical protein